MLDPFPVEESDSSVQRHRQVSERYERGAWREGLALAEEALATEPRALSLLLDAALGAVMENVPRKSLLYQKRCLKYYVPVAGMDLLAAVAHAQLGDLRKAQQHLRRHHREFGYHASLPFLRSFLDRFGQRLDDIDRYRPDTGATKTQNLGRLPRAEQHRGRRRRDPAPALSSVPPPAPAEDPGGLARASAVLHTTYDLPAAAGLAIAASEPSPIVWFRLRSDHTRLALLQEFDELLCLPLLRGVAAYSHQIETVRKVLKQFFGRVLLADEVGLGKTVEAGMVLKEYTLRGLVDSALVLVPAGLVGQWGEELESKFALPFASSHDPLLRRDPAAFWAQPRIIASIAVARRAEHAALLRGRAFDLVIVDEAHHLKNRNTANWRLVDTLKNRFLLLLSATPIENNLVELYNLLTLLKPGIFRTERDFRASYMTPGQPRTPANRERLRALLRDAMVRNTRALVDVRLASRRAATLRIEPEADEAACYRDLTELVQRHRAGDGAADGVPLLALRHLLAAAGSTPVAAVAALERFVAGSPRAQSWHVLLGRYRALGPGVKTKAQLDLLARNPGEKKMVFSHQREALSQLAAALSAAGISFARFDGSLSGPEKDAAVDSFREQREVLLCSESGGEGRNLQFCNTLINFDLPWNPMAIEQRIGRLHRIGQSREVFVFNLVTRHTLEEYVLRILDEKINMFELVVGEIGAIIGELDDRQDFAATVFEAWVATSAGERDAAFAELGDRLLEAKEKYADVKALDEQLFGDEFVAG